MTLETDWEHTQLTDVWHHPESHAAILGEDMPDELKPSPESVAEARRAKNRGTYIDELLIFADDRKYVPVPFDEIINWRLHPTRPVAPIAHRRA